MREAGSVTSNLQNTGWGGGVGVLFTILLTQVFTEKTTCLQLAFEQQSLYVMIAKNSSKLFSTPK